MKIFPTDWLTLTLALTVAGTAQAAPPPEWGFVNLREGLAQAKRENKPMFVLFGFDNCPWCKVLYRNTLSDEALRAQYQRDFVLVYMSTLGEREDPSYTLPDGRTLTPREIVKDWKVYPVPSWRWLGADGQLLASGNNAHTTARELSYKAKEIKGP